jgi:hypothetical protein
VSLQVLKPVESRSKNLAALAAEIVSWQETNEQLCVQLLKEDSCVSKFFDRVIMLYGMPENWDSHGAREISFGSAVNSARLFCQVMFEQTPIPNLVPTVRGNLQLEWHVFGIDLEVEVAEDGQIAAGLERVDGSEEEWLESFNYGAARLKSLIEEITLKAMETPAAA